MGAALRVVAAGAPVRPVVVAVLLAVARRGLASVDVLAVLWGSAVARVGLVLKAVAPLDDLPVDAGGLGSEALVEAPVALKAEAPGVPLPVVVRRAVGEVWAVRWGEAPVVLRLVALRAVALGLPGAVAVAWGA